MTNWPFSGRNELRHARMNSSNKRLWLYPMASYHDDTYRKLAQTILARFEKCRQKDASDKIQFGAGLEVLEWKVLLRETVCLAESVPEHEVERIVSSAFTDAARTGKLNDKTFEAAVKVRQRAYLSRPPSNYTFLTQISISEDTRLAGGKIDGTSISILGGIPRTLAKRRRLLEKAAMQSICGELPTGYQWARVTLAERSPVAAGERAQEAFGFLRASWNLFLNTGKGNMFRFSGPPEPVNSILLGPIHTIHRTDGASSEEEWWYDPSYSRQVRIAGLAEKVDRLNKFAEQVRHRVNQSPYKKELADWIRSYSSALDERDHYSSYLKLWQMIESATDAENYKVAMRRVARLFKDEDERLVLLDHLRNVRNQYVHAGKQRSSIENHLYMLKEYAERLLLFHVRSSTKFGSHREAVEFLDLPSSQAELRRQVRLRKRALRFHS